MNAKGQWTVPASMGACTALREHSRLITLEVLQAAEEFAVERSEKTGYKAAITREDVERAIKHPHPANP